MPAPTYLPLATPEDMLDGPFAYALQGASDTFVRSTMIRASRRIESMCGRRLAPFTGLVQTERAEGIASEQSGSGALPLSMTAALGISRAAAYGTASSLVRDVWLAEFAPSFADMWTYSDVAVTVIPPFGGEGHIVAGIEGPHPDTGHLRLPFGTFCPVGSTISVTYSGGYTLGVPDDLVQAAMMQATKFFVVAISPENRDGTSTAQLDAEIHAAVKPFRRA